MEISFLKTLSGFVPFGSDSEESAKKIHLGDVLRCKFSRMRNPLFHRKFFALVNMAYDWWEPGEVESRFGTPQKNPKRFRKDLIILAGYYEVVVRIDGSTRLEAQSISFAKMEQAEFEALYQSVLTVIIQNIAPRFRPDEIDEMVDRALQFA